MVCGGFTCSKNALAALNVLYIIVSIVLIAVGAYCRVVAIVTSLALVGGIIACGVFLFIIALIGLIGAVKHHQVLLFFYMVILFLLFLLQFALSCACLAVNDEQENSIAAAGWKYTSSDVKYRVQFKFNCCGFNAVNLNDTDKMGNPLCDKVSCCVGSTAHCCKGGNVNDTNADKCPCPTCVDAMRKHIHNAFSISGGVGLFFSFTEFGGVLLALRYRNQKDPRANPSAFL